MHRDGTKNRGIVVAQKHPKQNNMTITHIEMTEQKVMFINHLKKNLVIVLISNNDDFFVLRLSRVSGYENNFNRNCKTVSKSINYILKSVSD